MVQDFLHQQYVRFRDTGVEDAAPKLEKGLGSEDAGKMIYALWVLGLGFRVSALGFRVD